jgi:hypothetical protein
MTTETTFSQHIHYQSAVRCTVAHDYSKTELTNENHLNMRSFAKTPQVGEYILSNCGEMAYRVVRHQRAEACGNQLTVIFVSDPTPIQIENTFGKKGVAIHVHNQKCTSHCIDTYFLRMPMGYSINANLL